MVLFGDNEGIINGGQLYRTENIRSAQIYEMLEQSDRDMILCFYYQDTKMNLFSDRKVSLLRRLDYFRYLPGEKLIRIDFDYSDLVQRFNKMNYEVPVYICQGDRILFSNEGHSELKKDYDHLTGKEKIALEKDFSMCGEEFRILIMEPTDGILPNMKQHIPPLLLLILINLLLPMILMNLLNASFTKRLGILSNAFDQMEGEELAELTQIEGEDEIAALMKNYNRMVRRLRELIRTVYKDRLERQEADLAKQKAELLALRSQINPHFLFNVLESIRMHSILKKEEETADMIQKLAIMVRQNVDWSSDSNTIKRELAFVEAYLSLQKYRFGERLSYQINAQEDCQNILVPKLTITTFVENACVHGIEAKSFPGWIFVRVYTENDALCMEIEDTGGGMDEAEVERIQDRMRNASLKMLKEKGRVGMVNTCLRIRMMTEDTAQFSVESEPGIGTLVSIRFPLNKAIRAE